MKLRTLKKRNTRGTETSRKLLGRCRDSHLNAALEHNMGEPGPFELEEQWRRRYAAPRYSLNELLRRLLRVKKRRARA